MKIISIENIKKNMRLAKSVYTADGNVLLVEGARLTDERIERLRQFGVSTLYIANKWVGEIEVDNLITIQTKNEATKIAKQIVANIRQNLPIPGERVDQVISDLIDELFLNRHITFNLIEIRAMNDYLFSHSVTVCVLSLMTGIALNYNYSKLRILGVGAILHDIGKAKIPLEILNKSGKLTTDEYAVIQKHSQIGYDILKECNDIESISAVVALQHHERLNGSGYPLGLKGTAINEFARITALADVYDAMSSDRVYRKRLLSQEVIEYLRDQERILFDPELSRAFLQNIVPFPIGSMVLLNSGEKGIVIKLNKYFPARPVVKIIFGQNDQLLDEPFEKNLKVDLTSFILKELKDEEITFLGPNSRHSSKYTSPE